MCYGGYIHLEPLISLQGPITAEALIKSVRFFRGKMVQLDKIPKDNQASPELRDAAMSLKMTQHLVAPDYTNNKQ
jgi:hypothetical protein